MHVKNAILDYFTAELEMKMLSEQLIHRSAHSAALSSTQQLLIEIFFST